jgi:pimeloyl-ACP methyl ester carboxylesterase
MRRRHLLPVFLFLLPLFSAEASSQELKSLDLNGITLAYRVIGEGEPLVLLHGFTQTGDAWQPILEYLAPHYRLIIPDLRGHGRSTNPTGEFTHRQSASDVFGLLDQLGVEQFKAMGISSGGMTLLHMATTQPQRVDAMVLIGATSYFPEQTRVIQRSSHPDSVPPSQVESLGRTHSRGAEQARDLLIQFSAMADSYDDMNFTPPLLSTITASTLIIHGDRDSFFPVAIPVEEYQAIPKSYLWIVPNGGHVPLLNSTGSRAFLAQTVLGFLADEWR